MAKKTAPREPFSIGGTLCPAGKTTRLELPVARLPTGAWSSLPVAVVHGKRPGPTVWVSGAIHGDELNGIPIVRMVLKQVSAKNLSGTLIAVPIVNVFGILQESRYLPDRRDLNRSFPGSKRGSLAAQLAHMFMEEVVDRADLGVDCHTGSDGRANLPQIRCDLDDPETARLAEAFGSAVVLHAGHRTGTLREAAARRGKRVLLYEAGEALRFDREAIELGARGVIRVMKAMRMLPGEEEPPFEPYRSRSSHWVRASRTGFCHVTVGLGDLVGPGQSVAVTFDAFGRNEATLRARYPGVVVGHLTNPLVHRGDAVAHIAQPEEEAAGRPPKDD